MDPVLALVIGGVGGIVVGTLVGFIIRKKIAEGSIGSAEEQAKHILEEAIKNAESSKKEAIISAKEEIFQLKKEADKDQSETNNTENKTNKKNVNIHVTTNRIWLGGKSIKLVSF